MESAELSGASFTLRNKGYWAFLKAIFHSKLTRGDDF